MTSISRSLSLLALLAIWSTASFALAQQKTVYSVSAQEAIATNLVSQDRAVMADALTEYMRIPVEQQTPRVRAALVEALEIENERRRKYRLGEGPHWALGPDDSIGLLLFKQVRNMRDPAHIDALLPWLCCGNYPAWIDFGQVIIEPVLQYLHSDEFAEDDLMNGGIRLLQMMVDHWGLESFTSVQREQMREIAARHILSDGNLGRWFLLMPAIDLASAIEDTELIRMAETIANDQDELRKRSINSEYRLRDFKQTISEVTSGTREPYRHVPYEQYMLELDALENSH